jgi:hypothetical protein
MLVRAHVPTVAVTDNAEISLLKSSLAKRNVARVSAHEQSLHRTNELVLFGSISALLRPVLLQVHLL